jgi:neutral ceramidase
VAQADSRTVNGNVLRKLAVYLATFAGIVLFLYALLLVAVIIQSKSGLAEDRIQITVEQRRPLPPVGSATMMAGSGIADITPPPGLAKGGSPSTNVATGVRSRIKARSFYLRDKSGNAVALVQLDMLAGSLLLHHKVAEIVAQQTDIPIAGVMLAATHTHSAPLNILDNDMFNSGATSFKGLDPVYLEFVSTQIAQSIIDAYNNRRPARVAVGKTDIYGYNRNRSINAYLQNRNKQYLDRDDRYLVYKAVNPGLYMLRIDVAGDDGEFKPLGAFSTFSAHGTAFRTAGPDTMYNGDWFGITQREVQWRIAQYYSTDWPIAFGLATGTEGDMTPDMPATGDRYFSGEPADWPATKEYGRKVAEVAWTFFQSLGPELSDDVAIAAAVREIDISANNTIGEISICKDPRYGSAALAGPLENREPFVSVIPFLRNDSVLTKHHFFDSGCHAEKMIMAGEMLQSYVIKTEAAPTDVMFQLLQVGNLMIAPLPWEVTAEAGVRIADAIREGAGLSADSLVAVTSVANGFMAYTTTREEYAYQNYEGASTLYGPNSSAFIAAHLAQLAGDMRSAHYLADLPPQWTYDLAAATQVAFSAKPEDVPRRIVQQAWMTQATNSRDEDAVNVSWEDQIPEDIAFHTSLLAVEVSDDERTWRPLELDGRPVDDEGYDVAVVLQSRSENTAVYEGRWYAPDMAPGKHYRFAITGGKTPLYSDSFRAP